MLKVMTIDMLAPRGLKGVAVADTALGDVRGDEGFYHYRQYSAVELATHRSLEEVWHLLHHGHLPTPAERDAFAARVGEARAQVPDAVWAALPALAAASAGPLDGLRTALSLTAACSGMRPVLDIDDDARRRDGLHLAAVTPVLVAALHRVRAGADPLPADPSLGHAADYLRMALGAPAGAHHARAVEQYLVATIDHGFNASTFTARVVASTGADTGACLTAAVGALSGPLHGGAPSRVLDALDEIGDPANATAWAVERLRGGHKLMGFGHAVYRAEDPRSALLHDVAVRLGGRRVRAAEEVERRALDVLAAHRPGNRIVTNVEFWSSVVLDAAGLPRTLFTPTFAVSRVIGWAAHVVEQAAAGKIFRPSARYVGPPAPAELPPPSPAQALGRG